MATPPIDTLCYGDCLDWMAHWNDATVDLIYLDPPFNSNASYNLLYARDSVRRPQRSIPHRLSSGSDRVDQYHSIDTATLGGHLVGLDTTPAPARAWHVASTAARSEALNGPAWPRPRSPAVRR